MLKTHFSHKLVLVVPTTVKLVRYDLIFHHPYIKTKSSLVYCDSGVLFKLSETLSHVICPNNQRLIVRFTNTIISFLYFFYWSAR